MSRLRKALRPQDLPDLSQEDPREAEERGGQFLGGQAQDEDDLRRVDCLVKSVKFTNKENMPYNLMNLL